MSHRRQSDDPPSPFDPPGPFATNAFDCVTLIALAAEFAQSDAGDRHRRAMAGGQQRRFGRAAPTPTARRSLQPTRLQIDYNGPSGLTEIGASTGDPTRGRFDVFDIDEEGNDVLAHDFHVRR